MRFDVDVASDAQGWAVVMPVKQLAHAKTRITSTAETSVAALAFAFVKDTTSAVLACPDVDLVVIATSDSQVADWAGERGCTVVSDDGHPGINAAARHGAERAFGRRTAILVSDLPCLTPDSLSAVLQAGTEHPRAFLTDRQGTGTTIWMAGDGSMVTTRFGSNSRALHAQAGAVDLVAEQPDRIDWLAARHDIDTRDDLGSAMSLGVGAFTRLAVRPTQPS
jgi:2-phospho-L-lactate guanylyltransferase